ncbi:large conductance mechanosensitive channel protein MscL [Pontibacillus halophilus JSM 076056 = DSM 19796]|uniref:Large-conductance mechanosensitive channel n=1 Tax=Pontibacillus halophilus JSM 076056 = DSM 19796 TaxID=1385510 RepID=A0A0A5GPW3_9BACI|nr:large conductance mechanosensitive channel protein MscL [Pontibacillus halophilus]KGX93293.1 large conductance mechanosensitive channel protein MscL [Pontibacillus halophilus JSM 076056 = DSM 19796]
MWQEFKAFAVRDNAFELAVAVVIGTAFGKIVTSLVDDIIMPIVGVVAGGIHLDTLALSYRGVDIVYGSFLQAMLDFFIIAFSIFLFFKVIFTLRGKDSTLTLKKRTTEELLKDIRDLMQEQNEGLIHRREKPRVQAPRISIQDKSKKR